MGMTKETGSHVVLVLELELRRGFGREGYVLTASIPNREGTVQYSWEIQGGALDSDQAKDMAARAQSLLYDAAFTLGGIQGTLPGVSTR
jgi:hypothetical protein